MSSSSPCILWEVTWWTDQINRQWKLPEGTLHSSEMRAAMNTSDNDIISLIRTKYFNNQMLWAGSTFTVHPFLLLCFTFSQHPSSTYLNFQFHPAGASCPAPPLLYVLHITEDIADGLCSVWQQTTLQKNTWCLRCRHVLPSLHYQLNLLLVMHTGADFDICAQPVYNERKQKRNMLIS